MKTTGEIIRENREYKGLLLRQVAAKLEIDPSLLSKIETGVKLPTKEQIVRLAQIFELDEKKFLVNYLSDRLVWEIKNETVAVEALKMAEKKIDQLKKVNRIS